MTTRTDQKNNVKIGIIGKGFVGSAVAHGFSHQTSYGASIKIYDINPDRSQNSLVETVNQSQFLFLSVPTPSDAKGNMDLSIVESALRSISDVNKNDNNIVLLRSTVVPGTTEQFQKQFPNLRFVFNPEFLTERSAAFDFINQTRVILGGQEEHTSKVKKLYQDRFGSYLPVIETNFQTAELIKYMNNLYFATKVSFLNEMKLLADKISVDWDKAIQGFIMDGRIGHSHLSVPGPDGKFGFGGSCFPKDIQALISFADKHGIDMNVLKGAWQTNLKVRPDRDWEKLKGRAISG